MSLNERHSIWDDLSSEKRIEAAQVGFDPYLDLSIGDEPFYEDYCEFPNIDERWPEEDDEWDFVDNQTLNEFYGCEEDNHHFEEKYRHSQRRKNTFRAQRAKKCLLKAAQFPIRSVSQRDLHKCMRAFGTERHCADNDNKIHMKRVAVENKEFLAAKKEFILLSSQP